MKALVFTGRGGEYFRIWIVNILLTLATLTIYYPWAKVRTRRYFLGNTRLEGRSFDYHATGRQLLPGHLVVVGLVVIFVALQAILPLAGPAFVVVPFVAAPWIIWRSLSFNARMTSFSMVRFGFEGGPGDAYVGYMLWPILFALSLLAGPLLAGLLGNLADGGAILGVAALLAGFAGYALAFYLYVGLKKRQTRYVVNGHRYGQGCFATTVRTRGFATILLKTIGLGLLMLVAGVALVAGLAFATGAAGELLGLAETLDDPEAVASALESGAALVLVAPAYLGLVVAGMLIFAYARSRQRAYTFAHTRLDETVALASTLGARRLAWVWATNLLLVVVTLGLATPWARVRLARAFVEHTEVDTSGGFDRYVSQKQAEQSSLGEQLGDAFDVDVGVGF